VRRDRKNRRPRSIVITVTRANVLASARCTDSFAAAPFPTQAIAPARGRAECQYCRASQRRLLPRKTVVSDNAARDYRHAVLLSRWTFLPLQLRDTPNNISALPDWCKAALRGPHRLQYLQLALGCQKSDRALLSEMTNKSNEQKVAEAEVDSFRKNLGPFVVAAIQPGRGDRPKCQFPDRARRGCGGAGANLKRI
jgi:hypothetical protein